MKALARWIALVALSAVLLQLFFIARIATLAAIDPQSSSFERSQAWQVLSAKGRLPWRQEWVAYDAISDNLKLAVIASEDDRFADHQGVDWEAMEKAWQKNEKAQDRADKLQANIKAKATNKVAKPPKIIGGSTITQQLAKNLLLSGERSLLRKGQELLLTLTLEALLDKQRILEIYLNHVEWGEGVFGAEAAAQHYFRKPATKLSPYEAARLAVMLPRPRYFEQRLSSPYLASRAATIAARMGDAQLP
jgi:monofunctional glycosyltransferase